MTDAERKLAAAEKAKARVEETPAEVQEAPFLDKAHASVRARGSALGLRTVHEVLDSLVAVDDISAGVSMQFRQSTVTIACSFLCSDP